MENDKITIENNKKPTIEEKIKNRTSWFLLILLATVILFALIVAAVKILDVQILIKNFDFTALLSVVIAFFAIGLSVAFYNMASKSSDKFYSDIFGFIKSISESIGQMDSKLTEKMNSINKGQEELKRGILSNNRGSDLDNLKEKVNGLDDNFKSFIKDVNIIQATKDSVQQKKIDEIEKGLEGIKHAIEETEKENEDSYIFTINSDGDAGVFRANEVLYRENAIGGTYLHLKNGHIEHINSELFDLEDRLPDMFVKCHDRYIVNVNNIFTTYGETEHLSIKMSGGKIIPVQSKYSEKINKMLKERQL